MILDNDCGEATRAKRTRSNWWTKDVALSNPEPVISREGGVGRVWSGLATVGGEEEQQRR